MRGKASVRDLREEELSNSGTHMQAVIIREHVWQGKYWKKIFYETKTVLFSMSLKVYALWSLMSWVC